MLKAYASVEMGLTVNSVLVVANGPGEGGFSLREVTVKVPWYKDYVDAETGDEVERLQPFVCAHNSAFFVALDAGEVVGGAAGIRHCADAQYFCMTDGRDDVAVLADMRVSPSHQRRGIGVALFDAVADWGRSEGMRLLKIETQNTNVPAVRFYQRMGAKLSGLQRHAYVGENADEVMLLWYLEL